MTEFVGRTAECAALERYAAQARSGQPQVVIVEADAGGGKSTLLTHVTAALSDACILRAGGDEAEQLLDYGLLGQYAAAAEAVCGLPTATPAGMPGMPRMPSGTDPLLAGADLVSWLGALQRPGRLLVLVADDLQWADRPSAQALLFALRRLRRERVLVLISARPGTLARLGEGWTRFAAGDHRSARLRLGGFGADELLLLGRALGAGDLTPRAISTLMKHTGGNPLYCRILIEELGSAGLDQPVEAVRIPLALSSVILPRVTALSPVSRRLVNAAGVLGLRCSLTLAGCLAGIGDLLPSALDEAVGAGLLMEESRATGSRIAFPHSLIHKVVYDGLGPSTRRALHARAAELVSGERALAHRFAAATGPDDALASDLEQAAHSARDAGRATLAATWLAQASELTEAPCERDRRILDAVETLVCCGDAASAQALLPELTGTAPGGRRSALLGHLDLLTGRVVAAEAHLLHAWEQRDQEGSPRAAMVAASQLAQQCLVSGRIGEAIGWARAYVDTAGGDEAERGRAYGLLAFAMVVGGKPAQGLARLGFLPAAPAEIPAALTDALALRGIARLFAEELPGAVSDLSAAAGRLRSGVPLLFGCQTLSYLAEAEYRLGLWDEAVVHGELAVSLARDSDAVWALGFVHGAAALVLAARGQWAAAEDHVSAACDAALALGAGSAIATAATARAVLAAARQDFGEILKAAAMARATGRADVFSVPGHFEWPVLEVEAYLALDRLDEAQAALANMDAALSAASPACARMDAERLRGNLAVARGDASQAAESFARAWQHASGQVRPLHRARLEIDEARCLRQAGQRPAAIARLRSARQRLASLGAQPYLAVCDRELAACGALVRPGQAPGALGLTPAEVAVATLVAAGRSNRDAAAELYVSVKAVEFHLGHIYAKLGIHSRVALAERLGTARV